MSSRLQHRARVALAFAATTLILVPVAYVSMFSVFQPYDDEGFHLLMLRGYVSGGALYTQLVGYHGPFFYEVMGGFFKLTGLEITNDSGRLVTLFIWLLLALAGALVVWRLTRNLWLAFSAQLLTFNMLAALTNEPMQPGGLLSLLLMGLTLIAAYRSRWPRATAIFIGALAAAACLVKINVGAFAVMAVGFAFAGSQEGRWRRLLLPATGLIMTLTPFALMLRLLDRDWAIRYALTVAFAAAALSIAVLVAGPRRDAAPAAWLMIGSGCVAVIAIVLVVLLGGTQLSDLINSIVLVAYRQPLFYVQPLAVKSWVAVFAATCLALAIAFVYMRGRRPASTVVPGAARIAAGVMIWICALLPPSYLLMLAVPLVWVAAVAPRDDQSSPTDGYARLLLPALAVMESLQAYPVAGTQVSFASLGVVPVGAIILNDGLRQLRAWGAARSKPRLVATSNFVPVAALILSLAATSLWAYVAAASYTAGRPSELPGANLLRLAPTQQVELRSLSASLGRDCRSFITMPGMSSLYVWTGQEPPANLVITDWIYFLDSAQQQAIVDHVRTVHGMCVVRDDRLIKFWSAGRTIPSGPLVDFIDTNFVASGSYGEYELLVQR